MAITMADISKLRSMTGAGMMDCKNALNDANGDIEKAIEIIRKKGQAVAAKRSDREAAEGCVLADSKGNFAAALALKCETDFVAKNEDFIALTKQILDLAIEKQPTSLEELKSLNIENSTVEQLIVDRIGVTGEKMELDIYEFVKGEDTAAYIHPGNKLAAVVAFNEKQVDEQVKKDVAMQVAAMSPIALNRESVPADIIERELKVAKDKAIEEGKPENIIDRIAEGRLNKFYQETTLLEQAFIKDAKMSISQYLKQEKDSLTVNDFKRITLNQE